MSVFLGTFACSFLEMFLSGFAIGVLLASQNDLDFPHLFSRRDAVE